MLWLDLANDRLAAELGAPKYVPYGAQALPHNGSATRSLTFRYIVRVGDESERLETACVRLVSPKKPWRLHDRRRTYPEEYEAAAALIDAACPALPGDALEVVMAYCRWSDFFAHD